MPTDLTESCRHPASCRRASGSGGFSLIELLVVVAIISILAGIAVPNYLGAQMRAKVSRIASDQRVLATALESYFTDNNRYPRRTKALAGNSFGIGDVLVRAEEMGALTTPITYISSLPTDLFENRVAAPNNIIDYCSPAIVQTWRQEARAFPGFGSWRYNDAVLTNNTYEYGYALFSIGPDKEFGRRPATGRYPYQSQNNGTWNKTYDPTNGTVSFGNIYRFQRNGAIIENALK